MKKFDTLLFQKARNRCILTDGSILDYDFASEHRLAPFNDEYGTYLGAGDFYEVGGIAQKPSSKIHHFWKRKS